MPMSTKSRAAQWVERTLLAAKLAVRRDFQDEMAKRIDYYNDRQMPYLLELLHEKFTDADALGLEPEFVNIIKTVVDGTALVYRSGAARTLSDRKSVV